MLKTADEFWIWPQIRNVIACCGNSSEASICQGFCLDAALKWNQPSLNEKLAKQEHYCNHRALNQAELRQIKAAWGLTFN